MPWVAAPDEAVLHRVAAALDDAARAGAVLVGPDGVGKTQLAGMAAERFAAHRPSTVIRWVRGTRTEQMVPFGAFSRLIDIADIGRPAALLRAVHDSLVADRDLLVVIDDAHELDNLSATLVYQLALKRSARLIVTVRSETELPDAVAALSADDLLARIEMVPVDKAQIAALQSLPGLIDEYLRNLPPPVKAVLDYLAVVQPLQRSDLAALAGEGAVADGETLGAVASDDDGMVYAAHPLHTERTRAGLGEGTARALRTALVGQLSKNPSDRVSDQLRLSVLAIESDLPVPDVAPAAEQALRLGDLTLAQRLARTAVDQSGGLTARLTLAQALAWQGRGREADAVLAAVDPAGLSAPELMAWALPRAANQFWMLSEPERATTFLQTTRNRVEAPAALATLDALAATFAMNAGSPLRALRIADEVLAAPHADE
ncbi:MAG: AAA family ATPase, partial [Mycobacterium sp.]